jgi:hypothetical protein
MVAELTFFELNGLSQGLGTLRTSTRLAELGHTSAQLALLVDLVRSPFIRRITGLPAV